MQNFRKFREVPLMSRPSSRSSSDPQNNALLVVAMLAMVAVPAGIALHTVRIPAPTQIPPADATPYGYTVSLLLFIIPIIVIGWWFVGLPIEAVCVWIAVTYATVIVFEVIKLWQASERPLKYAFLGAREVPSRKTQAAGN